MAGKAGRRDLRPRRIRPQRDRAERFWALVDKSETCWNWIGHTNERGYGTFSERRGRDDWRQALAHRVSAELDGRPPGDLFVLHRCDNRKCVRPDHLFLGTQTDNVADMDEKGRRGSLKGSKHGMARLGEYQVQEIRRRRATGERGVDLAREFGVSPSQIVWITKGRQWRHVRSADQKPEQS